MNEWKQAFWLAGLECRESLKGFTFLFFMFAIIVSEIISLLNTYLDKGFAGLICISYYCFSLCLVGFARRNFKFNR